MKKPYYKIFYLTFLQWMFPLIYGKFRCDNHATIKDPYQTKILLGDLDGWSFLHLLIGIGGGFLFPNYLYTLIAIGIVWELFETYYGIYQPSFLEGWGHCISGDKKLEENTIWWYGKFTDILANIVGLLMGYFISIHMFKNNIHKNYSWIFISLYPWVIGVSSAICLAIYGIATKNRDIQLTTPFLMKYALGYIIMVGLLHFSGIFKYLS